MQTLEDIKSMSQEDSDSQSETRTDDSNCSSDDDDNIGLVLKSMTAKANKLKPGESLKLMNYVRDECRKTVNYATIAVL